MKKILFCLLCLSPLLAFPQRQIPKGGTTGQGIIIGEDGSSVVWSNIQPSVSVVPPLVLTTNTLSITQSTTSTNGYLSSTDWNIFNNKQDFLVSGTNIKTVNGSTLLGAGNLAVGTVTTVTVTSTDGVSGTVTNPTTTPAITVVLGSPVKIGSYSVTTVSTATVGGNNTGDQTITLTGDVTGSGTGSFATTAVKSTGTFTVGTTAIINTALGVGTSTITAGYKLDVNGLSVAGFKSYATRLYSGNLNDSSSFIQSRTSSVNKDLFIAARCSSISVDSAHFVVYPSAALAVNAQYQGFLPPRWSTTERNAIVSPVNGLFGYNSTTGLFNGYQNGAWSDIGQNIANANLTANASYTTTFTGFDWTLKSGTFTRVGSGATAGTTSFAVHNSTGTNNALRILDNGHSLFGTSSDQLAKVTIVYDGSVDNGLIIRDAAAKVLQVSSDNTGNGVFDLIGTGAVHLALNASTSYINNRSDQEFILGGTSSLFSNTKFTVVYNTAYLYGVSYQDQSNKTHDFYSDGSGNGISRIFGAGSVAKIVQNANGISYFNGGQVAIGSATADASAKLEVTSTTQGFRITPMTATQASAITPVEGLILFVSSTNGTFPTIGLYGYQNGAYKAY